MNTRPFSFVLATLFSLLSFNYAEANIKFGFKLSGGFQYVNSNDINKGLEGWSNIWKDYYDFPEITQYGGYEPFSIGHKANAELLILISPRFTLGIGTGYENISKYSELQLIENGKEHTTSWNPSITTIPFSISFYYYFINGNAFKCSFQVGAGYFLIKYKDVQHIIFLGEFTDEYRLSTFGIDFNGGFGFDFPISNHLTLRIDSRLHYLKLNGFTGDVKSVWSSSSTVTSGTLWYYEINALENSYPIVSVEDMIPTGPDIHNTRKAVPSMINIAITFGIIYLF